MTVGYERITDELRRLDDELAAAVTLPSVDAVIRRASSINRASTAAAAAVLTVGALGATTAVAQLTLPGPVVDTAAAATSEAEPSERIGVGASLPVVEQAPASVEGLSTSEEPAPVVEEPPADPGLAAPPPPPPPGPPPVVLPTTVSPPTTTTTTSRPPDNDDEDDKPTRPTKTKTTEPPEPTKPTEPPEPTEPDPPTSDPDDPPSDPPSSGGGSEDTPTS